MDARTLNEKMNYIGMEKSARRLLIDKGLAKAEDVAVMTSIEVCDELLKTYEVVACEKEEIMVVKKEDMPTYSSIVEVLSR